MARGRPKIITAKVADLIRDLASQGHSQRGIRAALAQRNIALSARTLAGWCSEHDVQRAPLAAGGAASAPEPLPEPPQPEALQEVAAAALEADDLPRLAAAAATAERLARSWAERAEYDPAAARTYATVTRVHGELQARLIELRPRADADRERLEALGVERRDALLARITAAAGPDYRALAARYEQLLRRNELL